MLEYDLYPDVFDQSMEYPGINIDPVSMDTSLAELQLDVKEDVYEANFFPSSIRNLLCIFMTSCSSFFFVHHL